MQPFLSFYRVYNAAEDDALELRIARCFPTYSKMSMGPHCEFIKIGVYDERVPGPSMIIEIEDFSGSKQSTQQMQQHRENGISRRQRHEQHRRKFLRQLDTQQMEFSQRVFEQEVV